MRVGKPFNEGGQPFNEGGQAVQWGDASDWDRSDGTGKSISMSPCALGTRMKIRANLKDAATRAVTLV
ncbi:hypothetical protein GCM10023165_54120 [Variovorax defluvii]|uniref:Uncharacterized protein n=1 Tax=Variovorax defluvii TaxID=913761 RepID=A0ABP8IH83_9BURK